MRLDQRQWSASQGWVPPLSAAATESAQLILVFGAPSVLRKTELIRSIRALYPAGLLFGCSTAGEICGTQVSDDSLVVTAIHFEHTQVRGAKIAISTAVGSAQAGEFLGTLLPHSVGSVTGDAPEELVHVLLLSDGSNVNGSDLIRGLIRRLPAVVPVTGGLAGDGARFGETLVLTEDIARPKMVAAVGLYGRRLQVRFGSMGGWDPFGPDRIITRSQGNVLLELDGRPALSLYKQYLGDHARGLPATGLLFPLSIRAQAGDAAVVRTIQAVDERLQSMTFAGDVPEGASARLSKANVERLIDGAIDAARICREPVGTSPASLAILISCVGRKLVMKQRVEEEVEGVREILGERTILAGFYSYGEIAPSCAGATCSLHNQTMTITTLAET
jgi:hypothetical protein